jgi:hypothetical protein
MLLEDLKILIKDFESVLSKDLRFKKDMYFKNQVKIIYIEREKNRNILVPLMLPEMGLTELTKPATCPVCEKPATCPVCEKTTNCPDCKKEKILKLSDWLPLAQYNLFHNKTWKEMEGLNLLLEICSVEKVLNLSDV